MAKNEATREEAASPVLNTAPAAEEAQKNEGKDERRQKITRKQLLKENAFTRKGIKGAIGDSPYPPPLFICTLYYAESIRTLFVLPLAALIFSSFYAQSCYLYS